MLNFISSLHLEFWDNFVNDERTETEISERVPQKTSEKTMAYIAKTKSIQIDWKKELKRQKHNSRDHSKE